MQVLFMLLANVSFVRGMNNLPVYPIKLTVFYNRYQLRVLCTVVPAGAS